MLTHAICGICVKRSLIIHFIISKPTHLSLVLINTHQLVKSLIVKPSKRLLGCFSISSNWAFWSLINCSMTCRCAWLHFNKWIRHCFILCTRQYIGVPFCGASQASCIASSQPSSLSQACSKQEPQKSAQPPQYGGFYHVLDLRALGRTEKLRHVKYYTDAEMLIRRGQCWIAWWALWNKI